MSEDQIIRPDWNESEFITFVLLYCAHVDMKYEDNEKVVVQGYLDKKHYISVRDTFRQKNDAECLSIIQTFKGLYYPTLERKEELLDKIYKLFNADGEYSAIEQGMILSIKRIL